MTSEMLIAARRQAARGRDPATAILLHHQGRRCPLVEHLVSALLLSADLMDLYQRETSADWPGDRFDLPAIDSERSFPENAAVQVVSAGNPRSLWHTVPICCPHGTTSETQ